MSRLLPRAESTPAAASSASAMSSDEQPPPEATVATAPDNEQMPALEAAAAAAPAAPAAAEASATATAAAAGASSETTAQPMDTSAAAAAAAAEEASRKRRSRWAPAPAAGADTAQNAATTTADGSSQPAKKSRWASKPAAPVDPVASVLAQISPEQLEAFKIQLRIDQITRAILNPQQALAEKDATGRPRSPSPEPTYDPNTGQRLNTRPARMVKQLERERQELIESLQRANPTYKPPQGYRKQKYERRLLIPVKEYPEYNFIGMIIGPRGLTQKRMEKESGCKIVIRGKGSQKEGRANHRPQPGDDEDLHVLIQGENEAAVTATTKEVEKLLVPIDETKNEHKARQLRELAVINGTLRDEIICRMCGQPGHRQIQCPQRSQSWQPANIRCQICNSDLHPSADCPQRFTRTADQAAREMNDEYSSFMDELTGGGAVAKRTEQPMYLTDGGQGGAGGGAGDRGAYPPPSAPQPASGGSGYHPDRLATRGDPNAHAGQSYGSYEREGGSRVVKGQDGSAYREFRAPAAAVPHLPAISHRDGFRDPPQQAQQPYGGGGYGDRGYQQPRYDQYPPAYGGGGYVPGSDPSRYPPPHVANQYAYPPPPSYAQAPPPSSYAPGVDPARYPPPGAY